MKMHAIPKGERPNKAFPFLIFAKYTCSFMRKYKKSKGDITMFTVIICNAIIIGVSLTIGACATAGLYIMACDEMTREGMGVRI